MNERIKGKTWKWIKSLLGVMLALVLTIESGAVHIMATSGVDESASNMEVIQGDEQEAIQEGFSDNISEESGAAEEESPLEEDIADDEIPEEDVAQDSGLAIDESLFPDDGMRKAIEELVDTDHNSNLSEEEIAAVTQLDLTGRNIYDLTGIEIFTQLQELDCSWNHLTAQQLAPYMELEKITYYNNTYVVRSQDEVVELTEDLKENDQMAEATETPEATETLETTEALEATETPQQEKSWKFTYISVTSSEEFQSASELPLDATVFPDEELRKILEATYDIDEDGILSVEEQEKITSLYLSESKIADLTGILNFKNLLLLDCTTNQLKTLELSQLKELRGLYCRENEIVQLDVIANLKLKQLECDESVQILSQIEESPQPIEEAETVKEQTEQKTSSVTSAVKEAARTYTVKFKANRGSKVASQKVQAGTKAVRPQNPTRRNYKFLGWYQGKKKYNFASKVNSNVTLNAKWKKVTVSRASIKKVTNTRNGLLSVYYKKVSGAAGYDVQIARSKNFKTGLVRKNATKTSRGFTGVYKNKTYYVRVRAYKLDSTGKRVYGKLSKVKTIKIKKGKTNTVASSTAATLRSVSLTSKKNVQVKVYAPNYIKSVDGYYYLFCMTATEGTLAASREPVAKTKKKTNNTFNVSLNYNTKSDRLQKKFAMGVKTSSSPNKYTLVTGTKFISNPEMLATSNRAFPTASTKKGLQVNETYIGDAVDLGVKHTTYNMCLDDMIATDSEKNAALGISYQFDGSTYWFDRGIIQSYDRTLNAYQQNGMVVSAIILLRYRSDLTYLMPNSTPRGGYYALKTTTDKARKQLAATFTFLAQRYAANGRIANWIIGNEVNNYGEYNYTGSNNLSTNAKIYADSFRLAYIALRSVYSKARVYISLDHLWNTLTAIQHTSRLFLNKFANYLDGYGQFNIAYHAYPSPLTAPEFWANTNNAINNKYTSPCITMGNISVLTNYVQKKFGSNTRIILSEQGFTSRKGLTNVYNRQAAAIAYAYYLAEFNPMIDAFILHRHIDHQVEISQGLALGLWTNKPGTAEVPGEKKAAWSTFKYMDTAQGASKTKFALKVIGKGSWSLAVPGYNASRFK